MKKLILVFAFALVMFGANAQVIAGDNPYKVDPSNADTFYIDMSNFMHHKVDGFFNITIKTPSGNTGNVRVNTEGPSMTNAPDIPENTVIIIRFSGNRIYFDFDSATDIAWIIL